MMAVLRILAALSLLSLTGCSDKAPAAAANSTADHGEAGGSASPRPPIHYDQTAVLTVDGELTEEQAYRTNIEDCQKAGSPIRPLTPSDVVKLGRVHVEAWIGPDKQSRHEEEWHLDSPATCQFALTHLDQTEIDDANGRATMIDGVTHKVDVQEMGKPAPVTALPATDGEMDEGIRQAGWSKQGIANANGAQCAVWQSSSGFQLCVWTGGRQWGFSSDGMTSLKDGVSRADSIVFWAHPGRGTSWKLATKEFSVGKALDSRAFAIPENATHGTSP
jgi:hypothetical protein